MGIVGCHWTLKKPLVTNYCACGGLRRGPPALRSFEKGNRSAYPLGFSGKKGCNSLVSSRPTRRLRGGGQDVRRKGTKTTGKS